MRAGAESGQGKDPNNERVFVAPWWTSRGWTLADFSATRCGGVVGGWKSCTRDVCALFATPPNERLQNYWMAICRGGIYGEGRAEVLFHSTIAMVPMRQRRTRRKSTCRMFRRDAINLYTPSLCLSPFILNISIIGYAIFKHRVPPMISTSVTERARSLVHSSPRFLGPMLRTPNTRMAKFVSDVICFGRTR